MLKVKLPNGWTTTEIKELCSLINGRAFKPSDWKETGLPIVRIQNLNNPTRPFNYYDQEVPEKFYIENQELLFAWSGTPGTSFGAHIWQGERAVLNQHIFRVLISEQFIDKLFFRLALNEKLNSFIAQAHGGVGLRHITKGKFEKTKVFLPPFNEQKRIVAKVEALQGHSSRAREALEAVGPLLERFRQSVLAAAFRGDLTREWREQNPDVEPAHVLLERIREERRTRWIEAEAEKGRARAEARAHKAGKQWTDKDDEKTLAKEMAKAEKKYKEPESPDTSELPELPEGWCWTGLDEIIDEGPSNGYSGKAGNDALGTPTLKLSATTQGEMILNSSTVKRLYESIPMDSKYWLEPEDLLVQRANSLTYLGASAIYEGAKHEYIYPDLMMRIRIKESSLRHWTWRWMNSWQCRSYFRRQATGTAGNMPKINGSTLRAAPIPLPPLEEQKLLVTKIQKCFEYAEKISKSFRLSNSNLEKLNQSILAKAFRGELVPQDPNDEPASVLLKRIKAEREAAALKKKKAKRRKKKSTS